MKSAKERVGVQYQVDYFQASVCDRTAPPLREVAPGHMAACHFDITLQTPIPSRQAAPADLVSA